MIKTLSKVAGVAAISLSAAMVQAADTIKVGVLHSLSGTMAISETTLKDTVLMMIEDQNKKGGLLGKKLEPVVVDPASNWPLFAEKGRELLEKENNFSRFTFYIDEGVLKNKESNEAYFTTFKDGFFEPLSF